ncbi:MAG: hypothetical protein ACRD4B_06580, partial [Acidobacteriota bacterium]
AHTLQEILTVKSDDVAGRSKTYETIVKGGRIQPPHTPAAFDVLVKEMKGLALDVELVGQKQAEGDEATHEIEAKAERPVRRRAKIR